MEPKPVSMCHTEVLLYQLLSGLLIKVSRCQSIHVDVLSLPQLLHIVAAHEHGFIANDLLGGESEHLIPKPYGIIDLRNGELSGSHIGYRETEPVG